MGAVIQDSNMSGKAAAQQAVARINEAALEMCKQKDDSYDLYVGKPILRGAAFLLKERIRQAKVAAKGANIIEFIAPLNDAITIIENIANSQSPSMLYTMVLQIKTPL